MQDNNFHILTTYKESYQYKQNKLQFFPTAEGYVRAVYCNNCVTQLSYQYVYNYTDHLGNIRLSYTQTETGLKILEENHYYPFGLKHDSYNQSKKKLTAKMENSVKKIKAVSRTASASYKYKYNGKELQDEFGLDWYDYGARNADPAVTPFTTIDPRAEEYYSQSPYVFASNNPVFYVDINGEGVEDTYSVDSKGRINHIDNKKYYDENGNEVDKLISTKTGESTEVTDGVLDTIENIQIKDEDKMQDVQIIDTSNGDGQKLFEFLADNTTSEFSHSCFNNGTEFVSTTFLNNAELSVTELVKRNGKLDKHAHSHPVGSNPDPSTGDIGTAAVLKKRGGTILNVYIPETGKYNSYNENSVSIELDEIIIQSKKSKVKK